MPDSSAKEDWKKLYRRRFPQCIATIAACLGGFALGSGLGWSAPVVEQLKSDYKYDTFSTNVVASVFPLGAAFGLIAVPFLIDKIGRKWTMMVLVPPFLLGWIFISSSVSVIGLMIVGRLITGACGGMCCVAAPMYITEISEKHIRGTLGVFFQLFIVLGILYAYCCGYTRNVVWTSILCGITPIIFGCVMMFMPESPLFYLSKDDEESARKSMRFLRGPDYDIQAEIAAFKEQAEHSKQQKVILSAFLKKPVLKTLGVAYGLMFAQQFSGINAVIFYGETIFKQTGVDMDALFQMVIFAVVQVIACIVAASLIDKLGRKFLMILSMGVMCVCMIALAIFFITKNSNPDKVASLSWLPLTSACIYIVAFSLGAGPIPWFYMGEIFPPKLKGTASSSAAILNWLLAFVVTVSFSSVSEAVGNATTFFFFSVICGLSVIFLIFCMVETKGKTFAEIQQDFGTFHIEDN